MPRVPRPADLPAANLRGGSNPAQINPGTASAIGRSGRAWGDAVKQVGSAFGEIATRAAQVNDRTEYNKAQLDWLRFDNKTWGDIEQNAGEDGSGYTAAGPRYEQGVKDIGGKISNPQNRERFNMWAGRQAIERGFQGARRQQAALAKQNISVEDKELAGALERIRANPSMETYKALVDPVTGLIQAGEGAYHTKATSTERQRQARGKMLGAVLEGLKEKDPDAAAALYEKISKGKYKVDQAEQGGGNIASAAKTREFLYSRLQDKKRTSHIDNLKPEMQSRLATFIEAAKEAGHDLSVVSGARTIEHQRRLWNQALKKYGSAAKARKWVAPPGKSNHNHGNAVDLGYGDRGSGLGGKRTASVKWAHANAAKFGLHFRLSHEDWHIESNGKRVAGRQPSTNRFASRVPSNISSVIEKYAHAAGFDPLIAKTLAGIESGGNPRTRTGSYKGLYQLSDSEFAKYGGGNIYDANDNARAGMKKLAANSAAFEKKYRRKPSATELYMVHQQGVGGADAHMRVPERAAWESMHSTGEGRGKGVAWSKKAIWGNVPPKFKKMWGSVERVSSAEFMAMWASKVEGIPYETALKSILKDGRIGRAPSSKVQGATPNQPNSGLLVSGQSFTVKSNIGPITLTSNDINSLDRGYVKSQTAAAREAAKLRQKRGETIADKMMKDQESHVLDNGSDATGYDAAMIEEVYRGNPKKLQQHKDRVAVARATSSILKNASSIPTEMLDERLAQNKPQEGDANYEMRTQLHDKALKRIDDLKMARSKDPALAVDPEQSPEKTSWGASNLVAKVYEDFPKGKPTNSMEATALVDARLRSQEEIGIPQPKPLTVGEAKRLALPLRDLPDDADFDKVLIDLRDKVAKAYGKKFASKITDQVITQGIKDVEKRAVMKAILSDTNPATAAKKARELNEIDKTTKALEGGDSSWLDSIVNGYSDFVKRYTPLEAQQGYMNMMRKLSTGGDASSGGNIPSGAVAKLRSDPGLKAAFMEKYGVSERAVDEILKGEKR